jgi:hypothetical protein
MIHFCTLCDKSYILKGKVMYRSINLPEFTLHWLCLDEETYNEVHTLKNVKAYKLAELEKDPELLKAKGIKPKIYGDEYSQYCWCLSPYFIDYLLKRIEENESLIYVDSDILFLQSPEVILEAVGKKSIGLHTHRSNIEERTNVGWYNIGVTVFKNDEDGRQIASLWKSWLLNPDNEFSEQYGTCGDQKYAEKFEDIIGRKNICVFDEEGGLVHLAPWCTHNPGNKEPIFFHFSHFRTDNGVWYDSLNGEWNPSADKKMLPYYEKYFELIKEEAIGLSIVGLIKLKDERKRMHDACYESYWFLDSIITIVQRDGCYGEKYIEVLNYSDTPYILNFMEDHFCVLDDKRIMEKLLWNMREYKADVCRSTFFQIELNSIKTIKPLYEDDICFIYRNTEENFNEYKKYYGSRYYIGCNFITTRDFALRFWGRPGQRPHDYEIKDYSKEWGHTIMIPKVEILAPIDDDHGEDGSCLLKRNEPKFRRIYDSVV